MPIDSRLELAGPIVASTGLARASLRFGTPDFPAFPFRLFPGTGVGQANAAYYSTVSITAGSTLSLDLVNSSLNDVAGLPIQWTKLKLVIVAITQTASNQTLRFGPNGVTDAAALWFPAATSGNRIDVRNMLVQFDNRDGWSVGAGASKLILNNPGAATVAGRILLVGV